MKITYKLVGWTFSDIIHWFFDGTICFFYGWVVHVGVVGQDIIGHFCFDNW